MTRIIILIFFILTYFSELTAQIRSFSEHSSLEILDKENTLKSDNSFFFGISIKLDEGWKTYWKNPGDSGAPLTINFDDNRIKNLEILFPTPQRFFDLGIETIGYEKEIIFPIKVETFEYQNSMNFDIQLEYLVCKEICIPVIKTKEISLNTNINSKLNKLSDSIKRLPSKEDIFFQLKEVKNRGSKFIIELENKKDISTGVDLFLHANFDFTEKKKSINNRQIVFELEIDLKEFKSPDNLVVLVSGKNFSEEKIIDLKINNEIKLASILFLAFIGGLILNFMPCVLPILSLKIYSFIKLSNENQFKMVRLSLSTIFGIFCSFIVLAVSIIFFKELGREVSWGMQFQSKEFLLFFSIILFVFSLNLMGFYEINLPSSLNQKFSITSKNEYFSAFFSGLLASILATPCSAPFLGTAISFAFSQENFSTIIIFVALASGFASPYFLIILSPKVINIFPKPGVWMINLRVILGIMVLLMSFWLLKISSIVYVDLIILGGLIFVSLLVFISKIKSKKPFLYLILIVSFVLTYSFWKKPSESLQWEKFNKNRLNTYINNKEIIFLDITADWCITCKFNKLTTLDTDEIKVFFNKNNVRLVQADWTRRDDDILNFLKRYNKYGIPFNIIYGPKNLDGIVLSEILTKETVKTNLNLVK